jgi:hypothetical protein
VALKLHEDPDSPWYKRLDLGGKTVGTKRIASLRTMQGAVRRMMRCAAWREPPPAQQVADITVAFWRAVQFVLPQPWAEPRHHVLVKGIGVYALMSFAGILVAEARQIGRKPDFDFFVAHLSDFTDRIDWTNAGPLHGYGGVAGADGRPTDDPPGPLLGAGPVPALTPEQERPIDRARDKNKYPPLGLTKLAAYHSPYGKKDNVRFVKGEEDRSVLDHVGQDLRHDASRSSGARSRSPSTSRWSVHAGTVPRFSSEASRHR